MTKKEREFKTVPQYIKAVNDMTVDGIFSVAGVLDSYGDIVEPGAFTKTFAERGDKTLHLWQHDFWSPPPAVIENLEEVGRADLPAIIRAEFPEATGGALVSRTYIESERAQEVLAAIKAGSPLEMSFGYDTIRYEVRMDEEDEEAAAIRHLIELRLWETSDVLWGANSATVANKRLPPIAIETVLDALDNYLCALKEGRRNASSDAGRINQIALLAFELGADNIKIVDDTEDDDKSQQSQDDDTAAKAAADGQPETEGAGDVEPVEDEEPDEDEKQSRAGSIDPLTLLFADLDLLEMSI